MTRTLLGTFRSVKRPIPNPKLSKSSSPTTSEAKFNAKPKSESWCVYLILSTTHPIKTYVGVTTNFPRRITVNLKAGQKLPVLEGHGFVHASFAALRTEVKLVYSNQNGKLFQGELHAKIKVTISPSNAKIHHFHYYNTGKQL